MAGPDYPDQVTFGCRIGHVAGQREPAAALDHPDLALFWNTVDWLVVNDPLLHRTVYHLPASD